MQQPPVGDICRFKGGELLAWTTVATWNTHVHFGTGTEEKANHMTKKGWTVRDHLNVREKNVIAEQLVPHDKILFPSSKPLNQEGDFFFNLLVKVFQVWVVKT